MKKIRNLAVTFVVALIMLGMSQPSFAQEDQDEIGPSAQAQVSEIVSSKMFRLCDSKEPDNCQGRAVKDSDGNKYRLPAPRWSTNTVVRIDDPMGYPCWADLPQTPEPIDVDVDTLPTRCDEHGQGWKVPGHELIRIRRTPVEPAASTPILVSERWDDTMPRYRSYAELLKSGQAWTIEQGYDNIAYAEARPLETIAATSEPATGLAAALEQTRFMESVTRVLPKASETFDSPENEYSLTLGSLSWQYHWLWELYIITPPAARISMLDAGAKYAARMASEIGVSPTFVKRFITGFDWSYIADMDTTLRDIPEWQEGGEVFLKRVGMTTDDAAARLWWRRRGKTVFLAVQAAFAAEYDKK